MESTEARVYMVVIARDLRSKQLIEYMESTSARGTGGAY